MKRISKQELINALRRPNVKRVGFGRMHENEFIITDPNDFIFELKSMKDRYYFFQEDPDGIVFVNKYSFIKSVSKFINSRMVHFKGQVGTAAS